MGNLCHKQTTKSSHPRLATAKSYNYQKQEYMRTKIQFLSKDQFDSWERKVSCEPAIHENSFIPQRDHKDETKVLKLKESLNKLKCGNYYEAEVLFPPYFHIMNDQISKVRELPADSSSKYIEEVRIWQLLNNLIQLSAHYHMNGQKVGDIRPRNILISGTGLLKIFTQDSWPSQTTNYLKTVSGQELTYLAPEEQHDVLVGYKEQTTDFQAGQAFSIGLTCLQAVNASLNIQSVNQIYNFKQEVNMGLLSQMLNQMKESKNYCTTIKACILALCEEKIDDRIKPIQMCQWLQQVMPVDTQKRERQLWKGCPEKVMIKVKELLGDGMEFEEGLSENQREQQQIGLIKMNESGHEGAQEGLNLDKSEDNLYSNKEVGGRQNSDADPQQFQPETNIQIERGQQAQNFGGIAFIKNPSHFKQFHINKSDEPEVKLDFVESILNLKQENEENTKSAISKKPTLINKRNQKVSKNILTFD